jgi:hypothetical protein
MSNERNNKYARQGLTCIDCARYDPLPTWRWEHVSTNVTFHGLWQTMNYRRVDLPENIGCGVCRDRPPRRLGVGLDYYVNARDRACCYFLRKEEGS